MITSWIIGKARAAALHEGAATVTAEDLQRQAFRWSEQLRKAIRRRDPDDAAAVFASVLDSAPASDAVALTAVLVAELAQYVEDEGVGDYAHAEHPVLTDLLDDCRVFGRSEEFFSEVLLYLVEADPDQQATIVTDLISASITAASLPSEQDRARWTDEWWRQVYPCALDEALEDAVLAMVDRGDLSPPDFMWRLSAYTIESLGALALHDDGLVLLEQHSPEAADLIYAYSEGHGRSQLLAVRRELDSIGPSDFGDVAIRILSALIVLERQDRASPEAHSPSDDASADPLTRWQDGQQLTWSDEHETWLGVVVDAKGSRYLWAETGRAGSMRQVRSGTWSGRVNE